MDDCYVPYERERAAFGKHWIGPLRYPHCEEVAIALFRKHPEDGDGQDVHVYCSAMPARFYTLRAMDSTNSIGEPVKDFCLSTGSGQLQLVADMAKAISEGMLGIESEPVTNELDGRRVR
jgi:hypothetical protein